jgi:hypothetical protein
MSELQAVPDPLMMRVRITKLLDEFYGRIDRAESIADLLDEQARFETPRRNAQGRDAFATLMLSLAQSRRETGRVARHFSTNVNIENLGTGQFRVRSMTIVISLDSGPAAKGSMNLGDHDDIVALDAGGTCRFVVRKMTPVSEFELSPLVKS